MDHDTLTTNIILYCQKFDETVRFYRHRMRLPVTFATDWFVEFYLNNLSRLSIADEVRASIESAHGNGVTISLEVGNIQAAWKKFEQNGLQPTDIKTHPWNARVFFLFDPEGHRIEIWEKRRSAAP